MFRTDNHGRYGSLRFPRIIIETKLIFKIYFAIKTYYPTPKHTERFRTIPVYIYANLRLRVFSKQWYERTIYSKIYPMSRTYERTTCTILTKPYHICLPDLILSRRKPLETNTLKIIQ